jgi:outer membrane protein
VNARNFVSHLATGLLLVAAQIRTAAAEDLLAVYRQAQGLDPVFAAARYQRDAVQEKRVQAQATLGPAISVNANRNSQTGVASYNDAAYAERSVRSAGWTLQLNQPLWRRSAWVSYAQSDLQIRQADEVFRQAQADLILRVSQAYFDALVAQESLSVADNQIRAVEQQLALARRNFEAGLTTITDLHEARSRFELARAQRAGAATDVDIRNTELAKILATSSVFTSFQPKRLARLLPEAKGPLPEPAHLQPWLEGALLSNPQIQAQQLALDIAAREIDKLVSAHEPTLDLTVSYGYNFTSGSLTSPTDLASRSRAKQIGVQFSLPLYAGGGVQSRVREAVLMHAKAEAELDVTKRQVASQLQQAFFSLLNGQTQIEALSAAALSSKSAVDANKIGYQIGTRINTDVLNAEQQLFATVRDLYKTRADTIMQTLRLKAAHGTLGEADLQDINLLLKVEP